MEMYDYIIRRGTHITETFTCFLIPSRDIMPISDQGTMRLPVICRKKCRARTKFVFIKIHFNK
ncbi:hypothetical protein D3C72_1432600 [compost metagenome]